MDGWEVPDASEEEISRLEEAQRRERWAARAYWLMKTHTRRGRIEFDVEQCAQAWECSPAEIRRTLTVLKSPDIGLIDIEDIGERRLYRCKLLFGGSPRAALFQPPEE